MICAVHQPNFLPYLGFFDKLLQSDVFVLYDTAEFSRSGFHNRNRIKTSHGVTWLTVPVQLHRGQSIKDVPVADPDFRLAHSRSFRHHYGQSRFYEALAGGFERAYGNGPSGLLVDVNRRLLDHLCDLLGYSGRVVLASDLNLDRSKKSSEALAEMVAAVGASIYLSGPGGRDYLCETPFGERGVKVVWQDFHHPRYDQLWGEFVPNLSVADALFNLGPAELVRRLSPSSQGQPE